MAASTRIKAQNIVFKIGAVDYSCDASRVELALSDAQGGAPRTFCQPEAEQQWELTLEGMASGDAASLYQILFTNYETDIAFIIAPQGNAVASATQPHYTGTVTINALPPLSLTAGETVTFTVTLRVVNSVHTPVATPAIFWGLTKKITA
jgi:hypothetical protein